MTERDDRPHVFRPNEKPDYGDIYWWPAVSIFALLAIGVALWKYGVPW